MMHDTTQFPVLWWIRRDLRLSDNPALTAAIANGNPVLPVFVFDEFDETLGAAPALRLESGLEALANRLAQMGQQLCLRRGRAQDVLQKLVQETGARAVHSSKSYLQEEITRDQALARALGAAGCALHWHNTRLMFEPWTVATKSGTPFKVYSPFWRAVRQIPVPAPLAPPARIPAPSVFPKSDTLQDWKLSARMRHSADIVRSGIVAGEEAALTRLEAFMAEPVAAYGANRDFPALPATSNLSDYLALGEISPCMIWAAGQRTMAEGRPGAEPFLKQIIWREFAWHLAYHYPHITRSNWRAGWERFPWSDEITPAVRAWQQGQTGVDLVDAGMREMWVTGRMHNRVRMIVGSYLTKHLTTHWKIGMDWFADCLIDWDPANNAMGWQWIAGSGPDAAPYFRVFNPDRQREAFDPDQTYVRHWIAEGQSDPPKTATDYFVAQRGAWGHSRHDLRPDPVISLQEGRNRALAAYKSMQDAEV